MPLENLNQNVDAGVGNVEVVIADYFKDAITATTYLLGIDLDNAGGAGPYKHGSGSAIKIVGGEAVGTKNNAGGAWTTQFGTILSISSSQATIGWLTRGRIDLRGNSVFDAHSIFDTFPMITDLSVSGGDYVDIACGHKEVVTAVNTTITLPDVSGVGRTPAVGDLVIRANAIVAAGALTLQYGFRYYVE